MKTHTISFYENEISEKHASSFLSASFNMLHSRIDIYSHINKCSLTFRIIFVDFLEIRLHQNKIISQLQKGLTQLIIYADYLLL